MKHLKMLGLAGLMAVALTVSAAGTASATTVETGGVAQNKAVAFTMSLKSGTSMAFKDTTNNVVETCTSSMINGNTVSPFTNTTGVNATIIEYSLTNCLSSETKVHKPGKLSFEWTTGTNGTVRSSEAEFTVYDSNFGGVGTCKTGTTVLGTLTGVAAGQATLHINTVLSCGLVGSVRWEATYSFTSPPGFGLRA